MASLSSDARASKIFLIAAASATASSLLTYAVFRYRGSRCQSSQPLQRGSGDDGGEERSVDPFNPSPRQDYLSWDDYFMAVAFLSAQRSKDPNKQVGACIVNCNNVICGIGYNGFPRGCPDSELPWAKKSRGGDPLQTKYPYVCHAEMNAILNKNGASVEGAKVFVTMFPCNECAKLMIQAGIREVVYHEGKDSQPPRSDSPLITPAFNRDQQYAASRRLLALAGVTLRQHQFRQPVVLRLANGSASALPSDSASALGQGTASSNGGDGLARSIMNGRVVVADGSPVATGVQAPAAAGEVTDAALESALVAEMHCNGHSSGSMNGSAAAAAAVQGRRRHRRGRRRTSQKPPGQEMGQQ